MKAHFIKDECWNASLWLICPATNADLDRFIEQKIGIKEKTKDGNFLGRFVEVWHDSNETEEWAGIIALAKWSGTPRDYAVLAHECLHATAWFLRNRGLSLKPSTEEPYCYLMDSLIRRSLEFLNKRRGRQ